MKILFCITLFLLFPLNFIFADNVSLNVICGAKEIYSGESFYGDIRLSIEGTPYRLQSAPIVIDSENATDYKVTISQSPSQFTSEHIKIVNNKKTHHKTLVYSWNFEVTSISQNDIEDLTVSLDYNGQVYKGTLQTVKVISPKDSEYAKIDFYADKTSVTIEDTINVTSKITLRAVSDGQSIFSPIPMHRKLELILPHLNEYPDTLELIAGGRDELIRNYHVDYGLKINNYPHSMNARNMVPFSFELPNSTTNINGTTYITYSWTTTYKVKEAGKINFNPISLRGHILTKASNSYDALEHIYISSKPLSIIGSEPPLDVRPLHYIGAISKDIKANAYLDTYKCNEGDPITLTIELSNVENPLNVTAPKLEETKGFSDTFRFFGNVKNTPNTEENKSTIEYMIRPTKNGTIEIPPIDIGFYDLESNTYKTTTTTPIPLRVNPAPQIESVDGESIVEPITSITNSRYYPTAISLNSTNFPSTSISHLILNFAIFAPFIWLSAIIIRYIISKRKQILSKLKDISQNNLDNLTKVNTPQQILTITTSILARNFHFQNKSLTPSEIRTILVEKKVNQEIIEELYAPMNRIFNLSFSPTANEENDVIVAKEKLTQTLKKINKRKASSRFNFRVILLFTATTLAILLPVLIAFLFSLNVQDETEKTSTDNFDIRHANLLINSAKTKEDFSNVAINYYEKLNFEAGCNSVETLHNYATVLTLAGYPEKAIEVIEYIETATGSTSELDNSMLFALQTIQEEENLISDDEVTTIMEKPTLPWYRTPLFWHYDFSISQRANALGIIWCTFWCVLIFMIHSKKKKHLKISLVFVIILLIFISSSYLISRSTINRPIPKLNSDELLSFQNIPINEGIDNE